MTLKKLILAITLAIALVAVMGNTGAVQAKKGDACTTIQSGELYGSDGSQLSTGYNEWGYNYQAKMYNGTWCDYHPVYRPGGSNHDWCMENYDDVELMMKWNNAWLDNKDCDDDTLLDRYYGYPTYIDSGAWLTNHERGSYEDGDQTCSYEYFVKIVAAPAEAYKDDGIWYASDGTEIGAVIWGSFAIIQEVSNDTCGGENGVQYISPFKAGLGNW